MFNGKKYLNQEDVKNYVLHTLDFDAKKYSRLTGLNEDVYRIKAFLMPTEYKAHEEDISIIFEKITDERGIPDITVMAEPIYRNENELIGYHFDYSLKIDSISFSTREDSTFSVKNFSEILDFWNNLSDEINNLKRDIYFNNKEIEDFKYNSNCYCSRQNIKAVEYILTPFCDEHNIPYYLDDANEMFYIGKEDDFIVGFRDVFDSEGRKELPEVAFFDLATDNAQAYERIDLNEDYSKELLKALEDIKGELEARKPSYEIENEEEERC